MNATLTICMDGAAEIERVLRRFLGTGAADAVLVVQTAEKVRSPEPVGQPTDSQSLPSTTTPAVVLTEKPTRKPRSDAGQPRGPHKTDTNATGAGTTVSSASDDSAAGAKAGDPVALEGSPAKQTAAVSVAPGAKLTKEDATAALGRINKTPGLGMPACMEHLKQFGVNRISILPEKDFALFIKQADEKIAEHLAAAGKK